VSADLVPAHLALCAAGVAPALLLAPEHGYFAVEQDMVPAEAGSDPWTGVPIVSLYGDHEGSLVPRREVFEGLDLLVIDLQDVGARYYTYAASAVWAAEVALEAGCQVWVLDRPNPLGGEVVEGNLPAPGLTSFVSAFSLPVRHGLTLGELVRLEARRRGWGDGVEVWPLAGWRRHMLWPETGRPWIAPSPNMPSFTTALLYPGGCLVEATGLSEGRGTTRPFQLVGAPGVPGDELARRLSRRETPGVRCLPTFFRPQFQKWAGQICSGVELVVTDAARLPSYRFGIELLEEVAGLAPEAFTWRAEPYEFVTDRPAIDLLTGGSEVRSGIEAGTSISGWIASWEREEADFDRERREVLLYR
jgi:uncharacterized protein YbbC (DUF1343 family)